MAQEDKEYFWNESDWEKVNGNDLPNDNRGARVVPTYDSGSASPKPPTQTHWYENVFKEENADLNLSEEDRKKLRRRERAERTIAGLGDLGMHIANVWGAAKNANPVQTDKTLSDAYHAKWKEMGLDYDKRKEAYRAGLSAARKMDYQQYLNDRKQYLAEQREARMLEKQRAEVELKDVKAQIDKAELGLKLSRDKREEEYYKARIAKLEEEAKYWAAKSKMPYSPNRNTGYSKSVTYERDPLGNIISKSETKTVGGGSAGASNSGSKNGGNNSKTTGTLLPQ